MARKSDSKKMYVVAVDMGYGHQRAAYPFIDDAKGGVINANSYEGISDKERRAWQGDRKGYELISYLKKVPIFGGFIFGVMDYFQRIQPFYPRRDLGRHTSQQIYFFKKVVHGMGKNLIERLNKNPLPFVTTFFVAAYFAEYWGYKGEIYCVVCDADISRSWAPVFPHDSRVKYLAPNKRVRERLQLYGVNRKQIYVTGFPLPKENIGGVSRAILKKDLRDRICRLDPRGVYRKKYKKLLVDHLGKISTDQNCGPVTITFAVGGAGAQRDLGTLIMRRLKKGIIEGNYILNLVAGSRKDVYDFFVREAKQERIDMLENFHIIFDKDKTEYFRKFNLALRNTDILWTKPSELTFYSGLGLPILMSEPVGSQENYNMEWLINIGAGVASKQPEYCDEWLADWIASGWFAEAAMNGYLDAPKMGTYHIEDIVLRGKKSEIEDIHLL